MGKELKEETAFSYLAEIKKRLFKRFDMKQINNSFAYGLREFNDDIKNVNKFFEENPNYSKTGVLLNNLNETAEVLRDSVEKLLEKNEKLNIIAQKSKNLKNTSEDMRTIVIIINFRLQKLKDVKGEII